MSFVSGESLNGYITESMSLRKKICLPQEVIEGRDHRIKEVCVKEWQERNGCMREGKCRGRSDSSAGSVLTNRRTIPQGLDTAGRVGWW